MGYFWLALVLHILAACQIHIGASQAVRGIGVCYGTMGNDLPPPNEVVELYKKHNISKIRLLEPNPSVLEALRGQGIAVTLGTRNQDVPVIASTQVAANIWFLNYINPYINDIVFDYIVVGNDIVPSTNGSYIPQAMKNLRNILDARNLRDIKVSTALAATTIGYAYPPSTAAFTDDSNPQAVPILKFLAEQGSSLLINVYPYYAFLPRLGFFQLEDAVFTKKEVLVRDGGLSYYNLFDVIVDTFFTAMEKVGVSDVSVVVSESGWPSAGNGGLTTLNIASTYNKNFIDHMLNGNGTPMRPGTYIQGFVYSMINENLQPTREKQNFGLFYSNKDPVYPVFT